MTTDTDIPTDSPSQPPFPSATSAHTTASVPLPQPSRPKTLSHASSLYAPLPNEQPFDHALEQGYELRRKEEEAFEEMIERRKEHSVDGDEGEGDGGEVGVGLEEQVELGHMQLVLEEGLWIGDVYAAMDEKGLREAGITAILSLLNPPLSHIPPQIKNLTIPINDTPDSDILSHLDNAVDFIHQTLQEERDENKGEEVEGGVRVVDEEGEGEREGRKLMKGAVLVHCQAGMSRSATTVAAYLMKYLNLDLEEAIERIREVRPIIEPSQTFIEQLQLYHFAKCRVSRKDKETRMWYLERTTNGVLSEGEFANEALQHMAKFPGTPTPSQPSTPTGGHGRRKIRCKMCRRYLATREHMMDHILDQSPTPIPMPRSRTPSLSFKNPSPSGSFTEQSPLDQAGAMIANGRKSRQSSMSAPSVPSHLNISTLAEKEGEGEDTSAVVEMKEKSSSEISPIKRKPSLSGGMSNSRKVLDADTLAASLPPQLLALRAGVPGRASPPPNNGLPRRTSTPTGAVAGPGMITESPVDSRGNSPRHSFSYGQNGDNGRGSPVPDDHTSDVGQDHRGPQNKNAAARKLSLMALTPAGSGLGFGGLNMNSPVDESAISDGEATNSPIEGAFPRDRRRSSSGMAGLREAPILVNPKCSGYFVEPLTWMEPFLQEGRMAGKITCPNEKCKAKIGNYDWAGVQCGCKDWVTPGFCIHRSKVDEVW